MPLGQQLGGIGQTMNPNRGYTTGYGTPNSTNPGARPPSGNAATGAAKNPQRTPQQGGKVPSSGPSAPPSFAGTMNTQFGTGNPFMPNSVGGMAPGLIQGGSAAAGAAGGGLTNTAGQSMANQWYGNSPIQTAQDVANRNLQKNLAGLRERYGSAGLGRGSDQSLAEGTAIGEMNTGLGDALARLGVSARQGDISNAISGYGQAGQLGLGQGNLGLGAGQVGNAQANTALNAILGAGQQNLAGQQMQLQGNEQLANLGNILSQLGVGEQGIPNANLIATLLGLTGKTSTVGSSSQSGSTGTGFLGF